MRNLRLESRNMEQKMKLQEVKQKLKHHLHSDLLI